MNAAVWCVLAVSALGAGSRGQVLEFSSKTCPPCQQVAPIIAKLEREGLPIRSIDVNQERELADQYNVQSIPTFILIVDGQVVERMQGARPESEIRQMLARIPSRDAGDRLPVDLGDSAPLPRPDVVVDKEPRNPPSHPLDGHDEAPKRFWPFSKQKKPVPPPAVRGNSPERTLPQDPSASQSADPMEASVRVRLLTGTTVVRGSGTIIESVPGKATILTCHHITRDATEDTKIEVDVFRNGKPITILGTIIGSDPDGDVGLISISTDEVWPTCPIASLEQTPSIGSQVIGIGCGNGADPSREQLRVTELNKFSGPDTVVCSGIPVQGRSGGGLFDKSGNLVGVCFAADADPKTRKPNGGVYCGLKPIHALLKKHGLPQLISSQEEVVELADAGDTEAPPAWTSEPALGKDAPLTNPPADEVMAKQEAATHEVPARDTPSVEEFASEDAEVVVVIRKRDGSGSGDKVILIHKPSRKFLQFVEGEVAAGTQETTSRTTPAYHSEAPTQRLVRVKPSTKLLLPTGMRTQQAPANGSPRKSR